MPEPAPKPLDVNSEQWSQVIKRRHYLTYQKNRQGLGTEEAAELERLDAIVDVTMAQKFPPQPGWDERIAAAEAKVAEADCHRDLAADLAWLDVVITGGAEARLHAVAHAGVRRALAAESRAAESDRLRARVAELEAALADMLAPFREPCRYDHNDFCQAHYSGRPCHVERGRAALAGKEDATDV